MAPDAAAEAEWWHVSAYVSIRQHTSAVKRLELDLAAGAGAAGLSLTDQMRTEVEVLSQVHHVNIVPLLGSSKDDMAHCLVYVLMEGGSL